MGTILLTNLIYIMMHDKKCFCHAKYLRAGYQTKKGEMPDIIGGYPYGFKNVVTIFVVKSKLREKFLHCRSK